MKMNVAQIKEFEKLTGQEHVEDAFVRVDIPSPHALMVNGRVVVQGHQPSADEVREAGSRLVAQIKRHVDDIGYVAAIVKTGWYCKFCGYKCEVVDDADGQSPGCCQKAIEAWEAFVAAQITKYFAEQGLSEPPAAQSIPRP